MEQSSNTGKEDPVASKLEDSNTFEQNPQSTRASEDVRVNLDLESSSYDAEEDTEVESTPTSLTKSQKQKHTKVFDTKSEWNFDSSSSSDVAYIENKYKLLNANESADTTLIGGENKSRVTFITSSSDEYFSTDSDNVDIKKKRRMPRFRSSERYTNPKDEAASPEKVRRKKYKRLSVKSVSSPTIAGRSRSFPPTGSTEKFDANTEFDNADGNYPLRMVRRVTISSEDEVRNITSAASSYVSTDSLNSDDCNAACRPSTPIPIPAKTSTNQGVNFKNSPESSIQYLKFWKHDEFSSSSGASKNQNTKKKKIFYIGSSESLSEQNPGSPSCFENPRTDRISIFYNPQPFSSNYPRSLRATESFWNNLPVEAAASGRTPLRSNITPGTSGTGNFKPRLQNSNVGNSFYVNLPQTSDNRNFGHRTSTGAVPKRRFAVERDGPAFSNYVDGNRNRDDDEVRSLNDLANTRLKSLKRAIATMFRRLAGLKRGLSAAKEEHLFKPEETD